MTYQEHDVFDEEEARLHYNLTIASSFLPSVPNRDPNNTRRIISSGRDAIVDCKDILYEIQLSLPREFEQYHKDRMKLVGMAESLELYHVDPESITQGNQPRMDVIARDAQLLEMITANAYISSTHFNTFRRISRKQALLRELTRILNNYSYILNRYETTLKASGGREGVYNNSTSGRATILYAYEIFSNGHNVFERIKETGDYTQMYGAEGVQLEVKDKKVLPKREALRRFHLKNIYNKDFSFCFPKAVRFVFRDDDTRLENVTKSDNSTLPYR